MATNGAAAGASSALWWEPFAALLAELENVQLDEDLPVQLFEKVKENYGWLLESVTRFKPANQSSREALKAQRIVISSNELKVQPELREVAFRISDLLCLDEVQSYILVTRSADKETRSVDFEGDSFVHIALLHYYVERQCLLKCVRQILIHSLYAGYDTNEAAGVKIEARRFIEDGLETKTIAILQELLSCSHPENLDVDLFTLWAEETLIEANLLLDTLFCTYYESLSTISAEKWIMLCSIYKGVVSGFYNLGRLAVSTEAVDSICYAKVQLLLILIETLNLENLLQMVHDELPVRQDSSFFSLTDIQEMDSLVSSLSVCDPKEAGPLYLIWAIFLCLVLSLPGVKETDQLETDHVGYIRQAIGAGSLDFYLEVLQSDILRNSDGPVAGYQSVLRTLVSAFIASYEINAELEDNTLRLILNLLCNVYRGEESLCNQFWDKNSFIDGPVRSLFRNLEEEFPFRIVGLIRLLSSLSEGAWAADCVYNFLNKSVGLSTLYEVHSDSMVGKACQIVETQNPVPVPGIEGLLVPGKTRGRILKVIDGNRVLVRWEYAQSGLFILVMRLVQELNSDNEEVLVILDLLCRLTTFNKGVCHALMNIGNSMHVQSTLIDERLGSNVWCQVELVEIICNLIGNLPPSISSNGMLALSINILAKLMKCSPDRVTTVASKANIFDISFTNSTHDVRSGDSSRRPWILSGKLAKMLLLESELHDNPCSLTISVLDFTLQLLDTGIESEVLHALVVFSLQYIFLNHGHWRYKVKHVRWNVTLKVLDIIKKCITLNSKTRGIREVVEDMVLHNSAIHNTILKIICTTPEDLENLYFSRLYDLAEIEGLELAVSSVLDILFTILSNLSEDLLSSPPVFCQVLLSSKIKPVPVVAAVISLVSYFRNTGIQVAAARMLSVLFSTADLSQHYVPGHACIEFDDKQITIFRSSVNKIIWKETAWSETLFIATIRALISAACYQPAFLISILSPKEIVDTHGSESATSKKSVTDGLLQYVEKSDDLFNSDPRMLLLILNFVKELWKGAVQYADILKSLTQSGKLWKYISTCVSLRSPETVDPHADVDTHTAYKYQCQSVVLEIMASDLFLQKKLREANFVKKISESSTKEKIERSTGAMDILLNWSSSPTLGNLIKVSATCEYRHTVHTHAKVAASLFIAHVMGNLERGDSGSLSVSLVQKIKALEKKLCDMPAFLELLTQYSKHHYSEKKELNSLILRDLYYHLQGELEGRSISVGPFKELSEFLIHSKFLQSYQHKNADDLSLYTKDFPLVDTASLEADLGLEMWDHSIWKASKSIAEQMLSCSQEANTMFLLASSKISAMTALTSVLAVYKETLALSAGAISEVIVVSCIDHIGLSFHGTLESVDPVLDARKDILGFLSAQIELVLNLIGYVPGKLPQPSCVLLIKTATAGLKFMSDFRVAGSDALKKLLLKLVLAVVEFSCQNSSSAKQSDLTPIEDLAEVSHACLSLLPILCKCVDSAGDCILSLTAMDQMLRHVLARQTWFPVLKKHLPLQQVMTILYDEKSRDSIPVILKFLLTLAQSRGGAEMLLNGGFFSTLRTLFADTSNGKSFSDVQMEKSMPKSSENIKQPYSKWGLGLAVLTASLCSFGGTSSHFDLLENVIHNLFSDQLHIITFHLRVPDFPSDDHDKKRARAQRMPVSLASLMDTEETLMLMCALVKHWNSWVKVMKDVSSDLREKSIHLLAYISRGNQRMGESVSRIPPLLCPPVSKEEVDLHKKPSFIKSRNGWFALCPLGCISETKPYAASVNPTALAVKDQLAGNKSPAVETSFTDVTAIQIYRIAFLVLKFLCLQAESATKRAEEMGFVDLAHFPELPMPDILHGLQDQAIAIVTELCRNNKPNEVQNDAQNLCLLLLQIMEMALYLELCVSQICGIKPVMGRVDDFSKEIKIFLSATENHSFLKACINSLMQIISLAYPEVLHSDRHLQLF